MYEVSINGNFGKSKKNNIKNFLAQNKLLLFLSVFLLLGVFCGSMLVRFADENTLKFIEVLLLNDIKERTSKTVLDIFISALSSTFIFMIVPFFMGLSTYGFIFAPFVPFARGICLGMSEVYLYLFYGLKGLCFHSLVFLPGFFVSSVAILLMAQSSIRMSYDLSSLVFAKKDIGDSFILKRYFFRSVGMAIVAIASSLIELLSSLLFLNFFKF